MDDLVDSFDMPNLRGRKPAPVSAEYVRELRPADIAVLQSERAIQPQTITKLRDRHHALARCLAQGMKQSEASLVTGYSPSVVSILAKDPTVRQLIEDYKSIEVGLQAEFMNRAGVMTLTAMNNIQDRLEDDENPPGDQFLLEVYKAGADRIGHGPQVKSTNVNVNFDLGGRLAAARSRLREELLNVTPVSADG